MTARTLAWSLVGAVLLWLAAGAGVGTASAAADGGGRSGSIVRVQTGLIQGVRSGEVDSFLGIPYAQAPVGDLRWRPPQPPLPWSGIRGAAAFGARCPQAASTNGPRSEAEDCLFVNVQRPAAARAGDRLPVY